MSESFNPYYKWLGIPLHEQPPNHYRLLGIARFEGDAEVIESAADQRMSHLKTYQTGQHSALSQRLLNEVAAAKLCLMTPAKKVAYDEVLRQTLPPPVSPPPAPGDDVGATNNPGADMLAEFAAEAHATHRSVMSRGTRRKFGWRKVILVGVVAALVIVAATVYLATGTGTIRIELSDPTVNVDLTIDGDEIAPEMLEEPLKLKTGQHELQVTAKGFETVKESFTVEWGENPTIRIAIQNKAASAGLVAALTPPTPSAPPKEAAEKDADREVAAWVLGLGGQLEVELAGGQRKEVTSMPTESFKIVRVILHGRKGLREKDLASLGQLDRLEAIDLDGMPVTDAALEFLAALKRPELVQWLNFGQTRITGAGLARLAKLSNLKHVNIAGTATDDAELARLPQLSTIEGLNLQETAVTDAAIETLAKFAGLRELNVLRTGVTARGLAELHKALPRCTLLADEAVLREYAKLLEGPRQPMVAQPTTKETAPPVTEPVKPENRTPDGDMTAGGNDTRLPQFREIQKTLPGLFDQMKEADSRFQELQEEWKPVAANCAQREQEVASLQNRLASLQQQAQMMQTAAMAGSNPARVRLASLQSSVNSTRRSLNQAQSSLTPLLTEKATLEAKARSAQRSFEQARDKWDRASQSWLSLCDPLCRYASKNQRQTIDQLNQWISDQPKFPQYYLARGFAEARLGQFDEAIDDFDKVGQLDLRPRVQSFAAAARGYTFYRKGDSREGGVQFGLASKLDPKNGFINLLRGQASMEQKKYLHAKGEFEQALRLCKKADIPEVYEALAWLLATCPSESVRNGKKAVTYATEACRLTNSEVWFHLDTLGAAYAEVGEFDKAIESADKALKLAPADNQPGIRQRKALYEKKEPFRLD